MGNQVTVTAATATEEQTIEVVEVPDSPPDAQEVAQSSGAAFLAQLRSRRGSLIEPHVIDGVTWYLQKMDSSTMNLVIFGTRKAGDGTLRLDDPDVFNTFMQSTIQFGVVKGAKDPELFFNPHRYLMDDAFGNPIESTELAENMREPEFAEMAANLFDKLTDINPGLWPQKKSIMEAQKVLLEAE